MNDNIQGIVNPEGKKNFTPTDILEGRKRLVNHFGGKIAGEQNLHGPLKKKWLVLLTRPLQKLSINLHQT